MTGLTRFGRLSKRNPLGTIGSHVPAARPCGTCGNQIRPARWEAGGKTAWVDADPAPDKAEYPVAGLVAYRMDGVAILHSMADLRAFYPVPAFRFHRCPKEAE